MKTARLPYFLWILSFLVALFGRSGEELRASPLFAEEPVKFSIATATELTHHPMNYLAGEPDFRIPFILPLEATIGRYQLGPDASARSIISAPGRNDRIFAHGSEQDEKYHIYTPLTGEQTGRKRYKIEFVESVEIARHQHLKERDPTLVPGGAYRPAYNLGTGVAFSYLRESTWFRFGVSHVLGTGYDEDWNPENSISAALVLGYGLGKGKRDSRPVHFTLGITSTVFYSSDTISSRARNNTEYGAVFFAPGLQLSGKSVVFQAHVEVPIHQVRKPGVDPETLDPSLRDEMRANIGMKYYIH